MKPRAARSAAGGVSGNFGGITTAAGGRWVAATEAGVTNLGGAGLDSLVGAWTALPSVLLGRLGRPPSLPQVASATGGFDCWARRGMLGGSLLLRDGAQHISGSRNMREVDLGLDLVFGASCTRSPLAELGAVLGTAAKMFPHQFGFVIFQRTGVRFLLRDAYRGQHVENFLALDFQLTGQIIVFESYSSALVSSSCPANLASLSSHI